MKKLSVLFLLFVVFFMNTNQENVLAGTCTKSDSGAWHDGTSYSQLYNYEDGFPPNLARAGYHGNGTISGTKPPWNYVDYYAPNRDNSGTTSSSYWNKRVGFYYHKSTYSASSYNSSLADGPEWYWYPYDYGTSYPRFKEEDGAYYTHRRPVRIDYESKTTLNDNTPPTITSNNDSWERYYAQDPYVTISASDSGCNDSVQISTGWSVDRDDIPTTGWSPWKSAGKQTYSDSWSGDWYLHVKAKDGVGNTSKVKVFGPYYVDWQPVIHQSVTVSDYEYKDGDIYWVKKDDNFKVSLRGYDKHAKVTNSYIMLYNNANNYAKVQHGWYEANAGQFNYFKTYGGVDWSSASRTEDANGYREVTFTGRLLNNYESFNILYYYTDGAGNITKGTKQDDFTYAGKDIRVDGNAPSVTMNPNGASSYINNNTITISATDGESGVAGIRYRISEDNGATWKNDWSNWSTSATQNVTLSDGANRVIQAQAKDNVGNISTTLSKTFDIDTQVPSVSLNIESANLYVKGLEHYVKTKDDVLFHMDSGDVHSLTEIFKLRLSEGGRDIATALHQWSQGESHLRDETASAKYDFTRVNRRASSGTKRNMTFIMNSTCTNCTANVLTYVEDNARNNTGFVDSKKILHVDGIAPAITITGVEDKKIYLNVPVTPAFTTKDDLSGVKETTATLTKTLNGVTTTVNFTSGTALNGSGDYVLTVKSKDNVNNESSKTISFTIYKPPTFTISYTDHFVYPDNTYLQFNSTTESDRHDAKITLYYRVIERTVNNQKTHSTLQQSTLSRKDGKWDTKPWSPLDLKRDFVKALTDGQHAIEMWVQDEKGATSAKQVFDFQADTLAPKSIKLYHLAQPNQDVALNSTVRFSVSALDPYARDGSYQEENKVVISYEIRKNGVLLYPPIANQTKLNNEPTNPVDLFLGKKQGYDHGDVITIKPIVSDGRGNYFENPPTYTVTIK